MKTDRELLELAARAAGIELIWKDEPGWAPKLKANRMQSWNPMDDDGDALRLAVKLHLVVAIMPEQKWCEKAAFTACYSFQGPERGDTDHGDDAGAATRRAIVRAAAAIGEAMP